MNIKDAIKNSSTKIVENILTTLFAESHIEVKFDEFKQDAWSYITYNNYDEDKEFSIRFHKTNSYDLFVGYYDDEDEFFEIVQPLTDEEILSIPEGLRKVMKKVVIDEDGLRIPSQLLIGKK